MTCKAYNGRVVTEWLSDALRRCHADASDPRMSCAYVCVILGAVHHSIRLVCVCVCVCVCARASVVPYHVALGIFLYQLKCHLHKTCMQLIFCMSG